jgi:hypothetical protein
MTDGSHSSWRHEETSSNESAEPPSSVDGSGNIN